MDFLINYLITSIILFVVISIVMSIYAALRNNNIKDIMIAILFSMLTGFVVGIFFPLIIFGIFFACILFFICMVVKLIINYMATKKKNIKKEKK